MRTLGWIVFILFGIRTLFSLGMLLEGIGGGDVFFFLGDLAANTALMVYLWHTLKR